MFGRNRGFRRDDEDVDSDDDVIEDDDEGEESSASLSPVEPMAKKAKRGDSSPFKHKVHQVLKKVTDGGGGGEFAISKHIPQAPSIVISLKVRRN